MSGAYQLMEGQIAWMERDHPIRFGLALRLGWATLPVCPERWGAQNGNYTCNHPEYYMCNH